MDIFGVGAAELILIGLVIMVVAGPRRSAVWARQAGIYLRQFQQAWQNMWKDIKTDLGPEGEELVKTAQELQKTASDFRRVASPRNLVGEGINLAEQLDPTKIKPKPSKAANKTNGGSIPEEAPATGENLPEDRYNAWKPGSENTGGSENTENLN